MGRLIAKYSAAVKLARTSPNATLPSLAMPAVDSERERAGRGVLQSISDCLNRKLKLKVNERKSRVLWEERAREGSPYPDCTRKREEDSD